MTTQIKVAYVNAPKTAKGPGSIKTEDGTYYKCWPTSKHKGAVLSDFSVGGEYEVEYSAEEYNGKEQRTLTKIVSGGEKSTDPVDYVRNGTPVAPTSDRSAFPHENYNVSRWQTCLQVAGRVFTGNACVEGDNVTVTPFIIKLAQDLFASSPQDAAEQAKEIFNVKDIEREVTEEDVNKELAEVSGW